MYTRRFSSLFVWLWLVALGSATTGIAIRQIYCYCVGETRVAWWAEEGCQGQETADLPACCRGEEPKGAAPRSCCEAPALPASADGVCLTDPAHDCTRTTVSVARMDDSFLVEGVTLLKNLNIPCWLSDCPIFSRMTRTVICAVEVPQPEPVAEGPPAWEGRMRCIYHQLYRC